MPRSASTPTPAAPKKRAGKAAVKKTQAKKTPAKKKTTGKQPASAGAPRSGKRLHERVVHLRPNVELALLSPYRFPVPIHQIAVGAARFGGVFFVIFGALGTLIYANALFSPGHLALRASSFDSVSGCSSSGSGSFEERCGSAKGSSGSASAPATPAASFDIDHADALTGTARVRVKVPSANAVTLSAYSKAQSRNVTLGRASRSSNDTWEYSWNTSSYDDGDYLLRALITNNTGTYESENSSYVTVANHPLPSILGTLPIIDTTTPTDTTSGDRSSSGSGSGSNDSNSNSGKGSGSNDSNSNSGKGSGSDNTSGKGSGSEGSAQQTTAHTASNASTTSPSTPAVSTAQDGSVSLRADSREAAEFTFTIGAPANTEKVRLYATNRSTKKDVLLGYAYKDDARTWKYRWSAAAVKEGEYEIRAVASAGGKEYASDELRVKVESPRTPAAAAGTASTSASSNSGHSAEASVAPKASVSILKNAPLSGVVDIRIDVEAASTVEISALQRNTLTPRYLGQAHLVNKNTWIYSVDTRDLPNGDHTFIAQIRNSYGTYTSGSSYVAIQNATVPVRTEEQQRTVKALVAVASSADPLPRILEKTAAEEPAATEGEMSATGTIVSAAPAAVTPDPVSKVLEQKGETLDAELQRYAAALRNGDAQALANTKERLASLQREIVPADATEEGDEGLSDELNEHVAQAMKRVEENVEKTNKIITERTPEKAVLDSDKDGVTDFDEVNLFDTDPFSADTDSDGFIDGAEILNGYDPKDAVSEAPVAFESPKETGIVREDILSVDAIATAASAPEGAPSSPAPAAVISGKALPNSYVTIYIFSTPVVVTIKTQEDGSWSYRFDKEIEDGQHEVYVGITDNAGKIVAKSNPLTFVKEAQAFTVADAQAQAQAPQPVVPEEPSLTSQYAIYLVLSISVVAIGLLLILLGLYLDGTARRRLVVPEEAPVEAV